VAVPQAVEGLINALAARIRLGSALGGGHVGSEAEQGGRQRRIHLGSVDLGLTGCLGSAK
jgi:hypothetical protein